MKHTKQTIFIAIFALFGHMATAQDATLSAGGDATGAGGSSSYSIGQTLYQANSGSSHSEIQGVQQPYEISVVTSLNDLDGISLFFSAYPNPTSNILNLKIEDYPTTDIQYQLTDLTGRVILTDEVMNSQTQMSIEHLASATYYLTVLKNQSTIKTFKIIKN